MDILRNILDENDPNYVLCMKLPALATLAGIISISMFFYSIFVVFAFIHQNPGVVITLIIIHSLILIMVLWSFARVFFSDPGYVKRTLRLESLNANPRQSPDKLIGANEKNQIHERYQIENDKFHNICRKPSLNDKQVEEIWSTIYTNNPVKKECLKKLETFKRSSTKKIIFDEEDQSYHTEDIKRYEERKSICDERDKLRNNSNDKYESSPSPKVHDQFLHDDEEISDDVRNDVIVKPVLNKVKMSMRYDAMDDEFKEKEKDLDHIENNIECYFCVACQNIRPPCAQHCKLCRKCVIRRDHHCSWVGNCIGQKNHKFLILLMFYSAQLTFFQFACYTIGMFLEWYGPYPLGIWFLLHLCAAGIDAFFCFLISISLLYSVIILFKNLTSERLGQFFKADCSVKNIEKLFGTNKCTWMIPIAPKNLPKYDDFHILNNDIQ